MAAKEAPSMPGATFVHPKNVLAEACMTETLMFSQS